MPAFGASELEKLENIVEEVFAEAKARRLHMSREIIARRMFDAAREGETNEAALRAAALVPDDGTNEDGPFPPDVGMRPVPIPRPVWPVPRLAA
jgi:hypothetical protein